MAECCRRRSVSVREGAPPAAFEANMLSVIAPWWRHGADPGHSPCRLLPSSSGRGIAARSQCCAIGADLGVSHRRATAAIRHAPEGSRAVKASGHVPRIHCPAWNQRFVVPWGASTGDAVFGEPEARCRRRQGSPIRRTPDDAGNSPAEYPATEMTLAASLLLIPACHIDVPPFQKNLPAQPCPSPIWREWG